MRFSKQNYKKLYIVKQGLKLFRTALRKIKSDAHVITAGDWGSHTHTHTHTHTPCFNVTEWNLTWSVRGRGRI